jgi:hypothetical protein
MRLARDYFTAQILGSGVRGEDPTIPLEELTHWPRQRPLNTALYGTFVGGSSGNQSITMIYQNRPGDHCPADYPNGCTHVESL